MLYEKKGLNWILITILVIGAIVLYNLLLNRSTSLKDLHNWSFTELSESMEQLDKADTNEEKLIAIIEVKEDCKQIIRLIAQEKNPSDDQLIVGNFLGEIYMIIEAELNEKIEWHLLDLYIDNLVEFSHILYIADNEKKIKESVSSYYRSFREELEKLAGESYDNVFFENRDRIFIIDRQ